MAADRYLCIQFSDITSSATCSVLSVCVWKVPMSVTFHSEVIKCVLLYYKDTSACLESHSVQFKASGSPVSLFIHTIRGSPIETDRRVPVDSGPCPLQPSTINTPGGGPQSLFFGLKLVETQLTPDRVNSA